MQITAQPEELLADQAAGKARNLTTIQNKSREEKAIKKVAKEFEAIFTGMMFKSMRETVGKNELTSGGRGEEIFSSLLDQEYANASAARGGTGFASMIEKELLGRNKSGVQKTDKTKQVLPGGSDAAAP